MKVTHENIKDITYLPGIQDIVMNDAKQMLDSLLLDLEELNSLLDNRGENYMHLYIDYENEHTEYSPERTDPCPDYYGFLTLRMEKNPYETIGTIMTVDELDTVICTLVNFVEFKLS